VAVRTPRRRSKRMELHAKLPNAATPVIFFELVPPVADKPEAVESALVELRGIKARVDAINLPEVRDESRGAERTYKFKARVEPRDLSKRIHRELGLETVVNRGVVYEAGAAQWVEETRERYGVRNFVLVGGESSRVHYPGPSVPEAAREIRAAGLPVTLGGIALPSRAQEAERIRRKAEAGLSFFTSQILFDSNDIVWLIQRLNGLEARIFLSFAPVSMPRDIEFLRWLGADVPADLDRFLIHGEKAGEGKSASAERAFDRSLKLARRILMDVFDNLPPDPPPLGLNIEHINRRNVPGALKMLESLGSLYTDLVTTRRRHAPASYF
jgi:5,10-methylenetetrahydrofolate reductase